MKLKNNNECFLFDKRTENKGIMIPLFSWKKDYILRTYVTLYIVRYPYVLRTHLTVWAEEVPNVYIHLNSVLVSNTLIFSVFCT